MYEWPARLVLVVFCLVAGMSEGKRPAFVASSRAAPLRETPPLTPAKRIMVRGGADASGEQGRTSTESEDEDTRRSAEASDSTLEESPSTEMAAAAQHEKETAEGKTTDEETTEDDDKEKARTSSDGIEVPSLDTFINYDEGTDALSSMAPVLETTTTHVLDAITHHEKHEQGTVTPRENNEDTDSTNTVASSPIEADNKENKDDCLENDGPETQDCGMEAIARDMTSEEAQEKSSSMRLEGKKLHDDADYTAAAEAFRRSALLLEPFLDDNTECAEDWSTCRLHEALCCLKAEDPQTAVVACTRVLDRPSTSGAVRARALYRRAKAYTGLDENDQALQDARAAAFLGDRRGVALYGQLMRESPTGSSSSSLLSSGSSGGSMMDDFTSSSALFESLLGKSGSAPSSSEQTDDPFPPFNPMSLLSGMNGGSPMTGGGKGMDTGGLAKSVMTSLSKKLEDESTQDTICRYLQKTSGPQIQQYAGMAGMELPQSQAARIANFLHGVTPKTIRKTVKNGKRLLYGVRLIRKTSKVISKYRSVLIWICLLAWAKSALLRPIPVNKRMARLAAKQAAKTA